MNSERKNYPMKEFWAIFSISSILVISYVKKGHISILAVIQKMWDLHKFGLQIWIQNAKITLWKNFVQFFRFHQFRWKWKNCPKFFHRVIFAFWIQICNPNICKSHIFWITANIEMWSFFAYPDLMTKIGEIGKIARNSFIG